MIYAYSSRKYRRLVHWIADNDNPGDNLTIVELADSIPVLLIADCFDLKPRQVAEDVWIIRNPEGGKA